MPHSNVDDLLRLSVPQHEITDAKPKTVSKKGVPLRERLQPVKVVRCDAPGNVVDKISARRTRVAELRKEIQEEMMDRGWCAAVWAKAFGVMLALLLSVSVIYISQNGQVVSELLRQLQQATAL